MATPTGIKQIGKPGGLVEPGIQKYGVMDWIDTAVDTYKKYKPLADAAVSLGKGYLDYKSQKELNELSEQAYKDYMAQKEAATQEAQAAIDLNLMPMEVTNIPTKKADVSDFTAVAARGGLMNLPTRQRKRYAFGPNEIDVEAMQEESIGPYELQMEEGVNISDMVFHDTGDARTNAQQVWQSGQIDQNLYEMDFEIFFKSGDWQDHISRGTVQGDTQMASAPGIPGIEGLRHGGRPGYADSNAEEFQITESVEAPEGYYDISARDKLNPNEMLSEDEEFWNRKFSPEFVEQGQKYEGQQEKLYALAASIMQSSEGLSMEEALERAKEIYFKKGFITKKEYEHPFETDLAKGGRVKYAQGSGIMNLGGLEKDYRTTGGFVPIGGRERADDVPARLSKNEFVMTADAVRAAGGGSINKVHKECMTQ